MSYDHTTECKCPVCDGPALMRNWEALELGALNMYRCLVCTSCGHFEGDSEVEDGWGSIVIEGVEMSPRRFAENIETLFVNGDCLLEWATGARAHMAMLDYVSPEEGAKRQELARLLARQCGELCDRIGRDIPPMLAKDPFLTRAWEHGVLYPRQNRPAELNLPRPSVPEHY